MEIEVVKTYHPIRLIASKLFVIPIVFREPNKPGTVRIGIGRVLEVVDEKGRTISEDEFKRTNTEDKKIYSYNYEYSNEIEKEMLSQMPIQDKQYIMRTLAIIRRK